MKRLLWAFALALALAGCSCDVKLDFDGGFFCASDLDCAEGFTCVAGRCGMGGTGGGAVGGAGGGAVGGGGGSALSGGLAFVTPARSSVQGACSQPLVFQLLDDAGVTQSAPFNVAVQTSSDPSMAFFSDDACITPTTFITVPQGLQGGTFRFIGSQTGLFVVTLSSPPLDGAAQSQNIVAPGMTAVVFTTAQPQVSLAGTCEGPLTVQLQDPAGVPQPAGVDGSSLDLALSPAGATAYVDAQCTVAAGASLNLPPGASSATFWVSSPTGASYTAQVSGTGLRSGQQAVTFAPLVHSGVCDLQAAGVRTCQFAPPQLDLHRTMLLYQATSSETLSQRVEATCVLLDESHIRCARYDIVGDVSIAWQTVELPGARVDRYSALCLGDGGLTQVLDLDASVPASSVFTLLDSNAHGTDPNANDFFSVANDGTHLTLKWEQQCQSDNIFMQVVQWPWANVVRASGALGLTVPTDEHMVSDADGGFFVLGTWRSDSTVGVTSVLCDRLVRPVASTNGLKVSRGAGSVDPLCTGTAVTGYELERVDLGPHATTQQLVVSMDAGVSTVQVAIPTIDPTRTFVLASGQSGGMGQGAGEGALVHLSDGGSPLGELGAVLTFTDPTHVQVTRGTANDSATFSVYVVQIEP